jgi:hypothetical protein
MSPASSMTPCLTSTEELWGVCLLWILFSHFVSQRFVKHGVNDFS